jgi:hypothetical protein
MFAVMSQSTKATGIKVSSGGAFKQTRSLSNTAMRAATSST